MFLLDTHIVSELRKVRLGNADEHVARWADSVDAARCQGRRLVVRKINLHSCHGMKYRFLSLKPIGSPVTNCKR